MSSSSFRKPEFRLHLGYPLVTLTRDDGTEALASANLDAPGFAAELRRIARDVKQARGRLTVILPDAEVWQGRIALPRTPLAQRRAARTAASMALAVPPGEAVVAVGRRADGGLTPVAGVRRATLADARRLLAGVGLHPDCIRADGAFPAFAAPARLWPSWSSAWPSPRPAAIAALAGGTAVGASAALVLLGLPRTEASLPPILVEQVAPAPMAQESAVVAAAPAKPKPSLALAVADPPMPRPARKPPQVVATLATRNLPVVYVEGQGASPGLRLAELTTARARLDRAAMPLRRPVLVATEPARTADEPAPMRRPTPAKAAAEPPVQSAAPIQVASLPPSDSLSTTDAIPAFPPSRPAAASVRSAPEPAASREPEAATPVVAAVQPGAAAGLAAVVTALPPSRPALPKAKPTIAKAAPVAPKVAARRPAPTPKVAAAPVPVVRRAAAPAVVRVVPAAPKIAARPSPVQPRVAAAPAQTVRRASAPARSAPTRTTKPMKSLAAGFAANRRAGAGQGNVALIGVFGGADDRHALLRLPSGAVARVHAGDSVQGAQVAAVGADTVRLRGRGRETVLQLPD